MHACIHACMHACIHTYMHACMHTYIHACMHACIHTYIKTSGSESRPRKVELASAHKKSDDYRKYFTHNNEACKNPYKTTLPHLYIH